MLDGSGGDCGAGRCAGGPAANPRDTSKVLPLRCVSAVSASSAASAAAGGTAHSRPDPAVQARVEASVLMQYVPDRSLWELAELPDCPILAVRDILYKYGVTRRIGGAAVIG